MNTAILILNWNGGTDTLSCLTSLLPHLGESDHVFIIDNGSTDDSVAQTEQHLYSQGFSYKSCHSAALLQTFRADHRIYIVRNQSNLGFGAGNNVVLKQLVSLNYNFELAWLLNNDARVEADTLKGLKSSIRKEATIAVAGSLILNEPDGSTVQCSGVKYYKWLGVSKLINKNVPLSKLNRNEAIAFDYLNGASLLFDLAALHKAGYFDERFFLYSEEQDLQLRLQALGYKLHLDLNSVVLHRLSGGTSNKRHLFYYYYNQSAVLLNRKHFAGACTLTALYSLAAITLIRTFPSFKNFSWGIKGIFAGITTKL